MHINIKQRLYIESRFITAKRLCLKALCVFRFFASIFSHTYKKSGSCEYKNKQQK
jgi:hypothetical protein